MSKALSYRKFEMESKDVESLLLFSEEMNVLHEELMDIKSLYAEIKEHYDTVKKSRSPGVLNFISDQTRNLISLKTTIITLIKEEANIKKMAKDIEVKGDMNKGAGDLKILQNIIGMLKDNNSEISINANPEIVTLGYDDNEEADSVIEQRLKEINIAERKNKSDEENYRVVFDEDKNMYVIDDEYNIIQDHDFEEIEVTFKRSKKTGERYAKDEEGNKYDIVDLKDLMGL